MADNYAEQASPFPWQSWAGVIGSLGLASVLIVIIGRLWTTTYFDHFGLPSSGMEFSTYDFAFRCLEALISLVLGAIGFSAAWLIRDSLKRWGFVTALIELAVCGGLVAWVFYFLPKLPDSWLATTGVLGLSSGLTLAAMVWFGVDVWAGPGGGVRNWPDWLKNLVDRVLKRLRLGDLAELLSAGLLAAWAFLGLPGLPDSWLAKTGILGLIGGLALAEVLWFGVCVWAGLGGDVEKWRNRFRNLVDSRLKWLRLGDPDKMTPAIRYTWRVITAVISVVIRFPILFFRACLLKELGPGDLKKVEPAIRNAWRIIAVTIFRRHRLRLPASGFGVARWHEGGCRCRNGNIRCCDPGVGGPSTG